MEQRHMTFRPPRLLEALAERLVPPASAEHVLGDLAECSSSSGRYLANLVSILPRVVWCQVRRRATIGFIVFNGIFTGIGLAIALASSGFFGGDWALLRAALPWGSWVAGCALSAAYGPVAHADRWNSRLFAATIGATLLASWAADVPVVTVALALAAIVGVFLLFAIPTLRHGTTPPLSRDTVLQHARLFQSQIRWRNAREFIAVVVVVTVNAGDLREAGVLEGAGKLLLIGGALFIGWYLHVRAGAHRVPAEADSRTVLDFHTREIARQRDVLRAVPYWYLLPFVPGLLVTIASKWDDPTAPPLAGAVVVLVIFAVVWWLNVMAARFLERQLEKVQALEQ
jgi:hypothetical protein